MRKTISITTITTIIATNGSNLIAGFSPLTPSSLLPSSSSSKKTLSSTFPSTLLPPSPPVPTTTRTNSVHLQALPENWRQYVPLIVSFGVITDILLGSPLANIALGPMKRATQQTDPADDDDESSSSAGAGGGNFQRNSNERVDAEAIGKAAVDRARYSMELRKFLEENKTQEQKYDDIRKKIDRAAEEFDRKREGGV